MAIQMQTTLSDV